jgi:hypothetical protein
MINHIEPRYLATSNKNKRKQMATSHAFGACGDISYNS